MLNSAANATVARDDSGAARVSPFYLGDEGVWYRKNASPNGDAAVSRSQVLCMLAEDKAHVSDDEKGDLLSPTMYGRIREKLLVGWSFTLEDVERVAARMFRSGVNPVPWLQNMLGDLCEVAETAPAASHSKATLVCQRESDGSVCLRQVVLAAAA